ncbi:protein prenyltransferase alpha subunit repeat-containing protein 1 [Belonocnema kinseyi]|uniref:protein prenyltransferase alpha subunit repeat-containing protein 1 n=1 Tax=Belonocnema kinseyi TaxID=2817044 RepID=UPI00143DD470|nr:protein prenyltransferase alpha subunit repeat-containing protein 1 [Belonocnema kinseyi]XP_033229942.1 protein prenyltransferase alpha subunit repeat-containing protein 1 [Belonocnema kinseyi]
MQEDVFPAAEKILSDIENVLKKDPNLVSFEIIPAEDNKNKSPVFHDENSLGLASWSVQPLFSYAYNRLLDLRQNKHRREDSGTVSKWLLGVLLLNPDISTFWNMKRELVKSGRLDPMQELGFASIVLYYKSKCFEAFAYRRWLVKFILMESTHSVNVDSILRNEFKVAAMAADRYANNCHAWSHREYALGLFETLAPEDLNPLLQTEWEESSNWCNRHVSDYSGFAYRQFLLKKLLLYRRNREEGAPSPERVAKSRELVFKFAKAGTRGCNDVFLLFDGSSDQVLDLMHDSENEKRVSDYEQCLINLSYWAEECMLNEDLIISFPGHEALWCHRRFLAYSLLALQTSYKKYSYYKSENFDPCQGIRPRIEINRSRTVDSASVSKGLLELAFRNHNHDVIALAKKSGNHQHSLAEKFIKYLKFIDLEL